MGRPNLSNADLNVAYDSGSGDDILRALADVLWELKADVDELVPKLRTGENVDPIEQVQAHLRLAIAALPERK